MMFLGGTFNHQVPSPLIQFIFGMLFLKYKKWKSAIELKSLKPSKKKLKLHMGMKGKENSRLGLSSGYNLNS